MVFNCFLLSMFKKTMFSILPSLFLLLILFFSSTNFSSVTSFRPTKGNKLCFLEKPKIPAKQLASFRSKRRPYTFIVGEVSFAYYNDCSSDSLSINNPYTKIYGERKPISNETPTCSFYPSLPLSISTSFQTQLNGRRGSSRLAASQRGNFEGEKGAEGFINDSEQVFSKVSLKEISKRENSKENKVLLIIPGYASDASQYVNLRESLRKQGLKTEIVPIKWNMWIPTFGGRSIRPILDRISLAVKEVSKYGTLGPGEVEYDLSDFLSEIKNPSIGASPTSKYDPYRDLIINNSKCTDANTADLEKENEENRQNDRRMINKEKNMEDDNYKVTLIAHSAGGWISRVFLSTTSYDGVVYSGTKWVDTLVTLGSPHIFPEIYSNHSIESIPFALRNLKFVNEKCVGEHGGNWEEKVKCICVGGDTVKGKKYYGFKDIVYQSYELCGQEGHETGDGITPLTSSLGLPGAKQVTIKDVMHGPEADHYGKKWYGSEEVLPLWITHLN